MMRWVAMVLTGFVLAGCQGSSAPAPRDHFYRISVPPPTTASDTMLPGIVLVTRLDAEGVMRERPLTYSGGDGSLALQQYDYHFWIEPPTRLLQSQLADYLRKSGVAEAVVTPEMRVRPDFEVIGTIRRLERLLDGDPPRVVAELELALVDRSGDRLRVIETYAAEVQCTDDSVDAAVTAMNQAIGQIFGRFLADMRGA